jgi:hypothetical protein
MAWQEIANIVNAGNSVQRDIKEIQKKWDNITFFLFSTITNSNIQTHPTLNVYPHKVTKRALSIYNIEKLKRNDQG